MSGDQRKDPLEAARAMRLNELVSVAPSAIVSRTLVRKPGGNVSLFAFAAGQELAEHTAPFDALVNLLEGELEVKIAGEAHRLAAGEVILMPADEPHALTAAADSKMLLIMLRDTGGE
jgi:quercetin dioxygenase-like cupin family protein